MVKAAAKHCRSYKKTEAWIVMVKAAAIF